MKKQRNLFGIVLLALCCVGFSLETFSQERPTAADPRFQGDREFKMDTVLSSKRIRDDDKMYQISVWRRIDLREKYNLPFYGSGDAKSDGIIYHIYEAAINNELEVYADDEFTTPLSIPEFQDNFWFPVGTNSAGDSIFFKNLYYIDFMEDFVFDKHRSRVVFDIKYIELVMPSEINRNAGQKTIGFIKFKDFYNHFKDHPTAKWFNFQNPAKSLPYNHAFDMRLFKSVVRKYTNPENALLEDLVDPDHPNPRLQAYLNSLDFEYSLLEWENTLWEW